MSSSLTAAVLGCGPRGLEHAEALGEVEGVELTAVADLAAGPREAASRATATPGYPHLDALLDAAVPDLLVVALPPAGRAELVERAATAGVRGIVVEKPFALRLSEAERMTHAGETHGTVLAVCHQLRFLSGFVELKAAVERGELGEVQLLHAAAFGNLLDQGPHLVDAVRWLAGERRVQWAMSQRGDGAVAGLPADRLPPRSSAHPAPAWMTHHLALEGGARAVVETGALYQRSTGFRDEWLAKRVTVVGSEGTGEAQASGGGRITTASGTRARVASR